MSDVYFISVFLRTYYQLKIYGSKREPSDNNFFISRFLLCSFHFLILDLGLLLDGEAFYVEETCDLPDHIDCVEEVHNQIGYEGDYQNEDLVHLSLLDGLSFCQPEIYGEGYQG